MSCSLPTLYNVQTQEKILDTQVKRCTWGRGRERVVMYGFKTRNKCKFYSLIRAFYGSELQKKGSEQITKTYSDK